MTSENDVLESIDKLYDQLFSKERQIADYIRANPQEVIMMNVSQLAKASKTSEATVVRTCKHLGYQGYYQMRLVLSRDIGTKSNDADLNEEGDFVQRIFEHNIQNLRAIASRLSIAHLCLQTNSRHCSPYSCDRKHYSYCLRLKFQTFTLWCSGFQQFNL